VLNARISINVPDVKVVPNMRTSINVPDAKVVPNVQDVPNVPDVPDVPRTTAHNNFKTRSHKTKSWQTNPRQKIAMPATTPERGSPRGHN
jgi:hypothetical protein